MELKTVLSGIIRNYILDPIDTPDTIVLKCDLVLRTAGPIRVKFTKRENNEAVIS